jgi:uncharacterized membrane protein YgdD (TMEM256/DUF423 family)
MKIWIVQGALFCFLGVVAGALGAHALKQVLLETGGSGNYELATSYMFYHGLGMMAAGGLKLRHPALPFQYAGWLFFSGTLLFQGNLFLIALADIRSLQILTPAGGLCLMAGWLMLALTAGRIRRS